MIPLYVSSIKLKEAFTLPREDYTIKLKNFIQANFGKKHVLFTVDGRNAIYLALKLAGMNKDDEILVPGYACQPVRAAIEPVCKPVYVDIDEKTLNIDPQQIEKYITKKTKAIYPVHLHGNPCRMKEIVDIAGRHNLIVIEDVVQSLGGQYDNKPLGSFGDFTIISFGFAKDIACYSGGALLSNKELNVNLKPASSLKSFFKVTTNLFALRQVKKIPGIIYAPLVTRWLIPHLDKEARKFDLRYETLSNYQCYLVYQQFARMRNAIDKRRQNAEYYSQGLKDMVITPTETENGEHTFYRYLIQVEQRDELYHYLLRHGIGANIVAESLLGLDDTCPHSATAAKRHLMLPVYQGLSPGDMEKVISAIYTFKKAK